MSSLLFFPILGSPSSHPASLARRGMMVLLMAQQLRCSPSLAPPTGGAAHSAGNRLGDATRRVPHPTSVAKRHFPPLSRAPVKTDDSHVANDGALHLLLDGACEPPIASTNGDFFS